MPQTAGRKSRPSSLWGQGNCAGEPRAGNCLLVAPRNMSAGSTALAQAHFAAGTAQALAVRCAGGTAQARCAA